MSFKLGIFSFTNSDEKIAKIAYLGAKSRSKHLWRTMQQVLVGARISGAKGATERQKGSRPQAKTFSNKMLKFLSNQLLKIKID